MLITKIIALILLATVVVVTAILHAKKESRWYVYALLQVVGLAALIVFAVAPSIVSFVYLFLLTLILSSQTKGAKSLVRTTLYTYVSFLLVFLILQWRVHLSEFFPDFLNHFALDRFLLPHTAMIILTFIFSTVSLIWFNFWTKAHNVFLYILLAFSCLLIPKLLVVYAISQHFTF